MVIERQNKALVVLKAKDEAKDDFINSIVRFDWCNFCYGGQVEQMEEVEKQEVQQVTNSNSSDQTNNEISTVIHRQVGCQKNCLPRYLVFCEEIGQ